MLILITCIIIRNMLKAMFPLPKVKDDGGTKGK